MAAENASLLKDLVQTVEAPADVSADPVVGSLVQRCRVLQGGVQRVIQKIQDESVMAAALQVHSPPSPPCQITDIKYEARLARYAQFGR